MKIYIIQRNNSDFWPEPEILTDGSAAVKKVKEEFIKQAEEFMGTEDLQKVGPVFPEEFGNFICKCYWNFTVDEITGDAMIERCHSTDRWEWRITEHNIKVCID